MNLTIAKWIGGAVLGLGLAWAVYAGIIRPTTKPNPSTTVQSGGVANTYNAKVSFGCVRITPEIKK